MSSFSSHEGNEKFFISLTSSFPSLEIPLFLYLFASRKTHILVLFFYSNWQSFPLKSLPLSEFHVSSTRKIPFKFQKTNPCISRKESHLFQKNSFIPILTLRKSSFLFQSLTNFKILFPLVGRFSYKNIKLLN